MNALKNLDRWHSINSQLFKTDEEREALYRKLTVEERIEAVKELCDLVVVTRPLGMDEAPYALLAALIGTVEADRALNVVNHENFSKFILENEIEEAEKHFATLGIEVDIEPLGLGYFGAISSKNQTVNDKHYPKMKLLKGPKWRKTDTNTEFWR